MVQVGPTLLNPIPRGKCETPSSVISHRDMFSLYGFYQYLICFNIGILDNLGHVW